MYSDKRESQWSVGHVCFIGNYEYFIRDNGELYRGPLSNCFDRDGYRNGRWVAPAHMIDSAIAMYREAQELYGDK